MSNPPNHNAVLVFSVLFPNQAQPNAGVFVRERMFRVAKQLPLVVVAPQPWFPLQSLLRIIKPHFRPQAPSEEVQQGITVYHPKFLSFPGVLKRFDGFFLAVSTYFCVKALVAKHRVGVIDSHFAYPDGYAATLLGKWLKLPVTITLRGTEVPHSAKPPLRKRLLQALGRANQVFAVADFLKQHVIGQGADGTKIQVVGNGVDSEKFFPHPRQAMREKYRFSPDDKILISVGGLVERKGFHLVIEQLPKLIEQEPNLKLVIIGGANAEGDWGDKLKSMVRRLGLEQRVIFTGPQPSQVICEYLSLADVFVLATRNEGWANVFLEAMACGLPVITTRVGGNPEVVVNDDLGALVDYGDATALYEALAMALQKNWSRETILSYAKDNSWNERVNLLVPAFQRLMGHGDTKVGQR